jgi:hypothetical protein
MINSNADLYAFIESLSLELKKAGDQQSGEALTAALIVSSVAGEVLGEIRLQLRRLQKSPMVAQLSLQSRVDEALIYLNKVLRPSIF